MGQLKADRETVPALALGVSAVGGCGAVWLWWDDTASFTAGLGNELTNAGRLLGLVAGYALVLQLVLMARVPWLTRHLGLRRVTRWHGWLGRWVVTALVGHAVCITWGYAANAHRGVGAQLLRLWRHYPDVLMATVALGLFVAVGVSTARRVRSRMPHEVWHHLHLYVYLATALAFSHAFAGGAEFSRSERNRVLWSSLYVLGIGLVVVFRIAVPLARRAGHRPLRELLVRRVLASTAATLVGLVVLLSFKTHPTRGVRTSLVASTPLPSDVPPSVVPSPPADPSPSPEVSPSKAHHSPSPSRAAVTTSPVREPSVRASVAPSPKPSPKASPQASSSHKPSPKPSHRPSPSAAPTTTAPAGPRSVTGRAVSTMYGTVQVVITVSNGRITSASVVQIPDQDDMDRDINDRAVPILNAQAVDRQSANLDTVSGATYTSSGYAASLQSAIDAAGL